MRRIFICIIFLSLLSVNEVNSQTPCSLSGASVYLDYSTTPALMNLLNGMSRTIILGIMVLLGLIKL